MAALIVSGEKRGRCRTGVQEGGAQTVDSIAGAPSGRKFVAGTGQENGRVAMHIFSGDTAAKRREMPPRKREELPGALAKMLAARAEKPDESPPDSHETVSCPVIARKSPPLFTDSGEGE